MRIYYLQRFWFFNVYNSSTTQQNHQYTMTFDPLVTVKGQIFLNILSPGISFDQNAVGLAAACVKMYTYIDSNGNEQTVDYTERDPFGSIYVTNITSVTWKLIVTLAWVGSARHDLLHRVSVKAKRCHPRRNLKPDVEVVERAIIYDPETGEILGSHSFGATGQVSEQTSRRFEALLRSQIDTLEKRQGCKLAVHRSSESKQLHTLHHRIDPSTGRLIEHPRVPGRTNVE